MTTREVKGKQPGHTVTRPGGWKRRAGGAVLAAQMTNQEGRVFLRKQTEKCSQGGKRKVRDSSRT